MCPPSDRAATGAASKRRRGAGGRRRPRAMREFARVPRLGFVVEVRSRGRRADPCRWESGSRSAAAPRVDAADGGTALERPGTGGHALDIVHAPQPRAGPRHARHPRAAGRCARLARRRWSRARAAASHGVGGCASRPRAAPNRAVAQATTRRGRRRSRVLESGLEPDRRRRTERLRCPNDARRAAPAQFVLGLLRPAPRSQPTRCLGWTGSRIIDTRS